MTVANLNALYQRYNPNRRPDWRWERVLGMVDRPHGKARATRHDDGYVRAGRAMIGKWRETPEEDRPVLFVEHPALFIAYQMFVRQSEEPDDALFLQARLLADMEYATIAAEMDTLPQAIEWYEALFFDVKAHLSSHDWIVKQVLLPAIMRNWGLFDSKGKQVKPKAADADDAPAGDFSLSWRHQTIAKPFADPSLLMFAYFGGPVVCEYMISGFQRGKRCQSPDALAEWLDVHTSTTLRARAAQAARMFEVNRYNVMELFQAHSRIMEIEKSADSADTKRDALERHVGALVSEMKGVWSVGDDDSAFRDTEVALYDAMDAELRDDELLVAAAGGKVKADGLAQLMLPRPVAEKKVADAK